MNRIRKCIKCGAEFRAISGYRKICDPCKAARNLRHCRACGKRLDETHKLFCSAECYAKHDWIAPTNLGEARCAICNGVFLKKTASQIYCSPKCNYKGKAINDRKRRAAMRNLPVREHPGGEIIKCNMCGKPFRSWDKTRNRRCAVCQQRVENVYSGVENRFLEEAID